MVLRQKKSKTTDAFKEDAMRNFVFATLVVLAFSANSQDILTLDPEALTSFSVMSEEVRTPRMARAPEVEVPVTKMPCEAAVVVHLSGKPGTTDVFGVSGHLLSYLPAGTQIRSWIRKPSGEIYAPSVLESIPTTSGTNWQRTIWYNTLPADWGEGVTSFEYVVSVGEWRCTAVARVATGGVYPAGSPSLGPLEEAIVDSAGGVLLRGVFKTSPIVVAPTYLNQKVELVGDNYVPPGAIGAGNKPLGVCSGRDGDPFFLECSTEFVPIPVF